MSKALTVLIAAILLAGGVTIAVIYATGDDFFTGPGRKPPLPQADNPPPVETSQPQPELPTEPQAAPDSDTDVADEDEDDDPTRPPSIWDQAVKDVKVFAPKDPNDSQAVAAYMQRVVNEYNRRLAESQQNPPPPAVEAPPLMPTEPEKTKITRTTPITQLEMINIVRTMDTETFKTIVHGEQEPMIKQMAIIGFDFVLKVATRPDPYGNVPTVEQIQSRDDWQFLHQVAKNHPDAGLRESTWRLLVETLNSSEDRVPLLKDVIIYESRRDKRHQAKEGLRWAKRELKRLGHMK